MIGSPMKYLSSFVVLVVITSCCYSDDKKKTDDPFVTLPATLTASPGVNFYLIPKTNCTGLKWRIPSTLTQDTQIVLKDPNAIALSGPAGTYTVDCWGASGGVPSNIASCTITIGTPTPPPPPPPSNPLTVALQTAFAKDTDIDRATSLTFLQTVYPAMSSAAGAASPTAPWSNIKTVGDAVNVMISVVQAAQGGLNQTQVVNLRKAIMSNFESQFGTTTTTAITLPALTTWLGNVSTALAGVK